MPIYFYQQYSHLVIDPANIRFPAEVAEKHQKRPQRDTYESVGTCQTEEE